MSEAEATGVFIGAGERYNRPGRIVTFGDYLGATRVMDASGALRYVRENAAEYSASGDQVADLARAVRWTRWINALNQGRRWPITRLAERLEGMLAPGIAVAVVPSHDPFADTPPIRELARALAATHDRIDATGCLVRHTKIKRIVYGGPSYRSLHRQTISVRDPERIAGRAVLLLDDIAKSGASLRACSELLYEAGAAFVQTVALGKVV